MGAATVAAAARSAVVAGAAMWGAAAGIEGPQLEHGEDTLERVTREAEATAVGVRAAASP